MIKVKFVKLVGDSKFQMPRASSNYNEKMKNVTNVTPNVNKTISNQ